jgi:hypothetical protein
MSFLGTGGNCDHFLGTGGNCDHFLGTGGNCDHFSLNVNILGKTAVLHLAHFCGWGCAKLSLQFI